MIAAYAARFSPDDPVSALEVGERPAPETRESWSVVDVRAAALNHHDVWTLRGVGLRAEQLPMILGTDAAGVTADGREVVVHAVIGGASGHGVGADEPRSLLSERYPGTLAEQVAVPDVEPRRQARRAVVRRGRVPADRLADRLPDAVPLGRRDPRAAGPRAGRGRRAGDRGDPARRRRGARGDRDQPVEERRERALTLGAAAAVEPGARVPRVDVVLESVGKATWSHSVRSVRPGGTIVVAGATSGDAEPAELTRIFFQEITVVGATMGTRDDLAAPARVPRAHRRAAAGRLDVPAGRRARRRAAARGG